MTKRVVAILLLTAFGLALGGCTKCGFVWDEGAHACHATKTG